jgi:hypothetical protein
MELMFIVDGADICIVDGLMELIYIVDEADICIVD